MSRRISPVDPTLAQGPVKDLLGSIKAKIGMVPNAFKTMAQAPALLEGYLSLSGALSKGVLPASIREQIALTVSQANRCEYCLSAHTLTARHAGLKPDQITDARQGKAEDPKAQAVLNLVHNILERRGDISDEQLSDARKAGVGDSEISEVVGNVALMTLTNYFNQVVRTDIDFPRVLVAM
ncbi:MAG: Carboxymuconolactone decarboxylase family protein [Planctomycetaceae bacterium]|nr:Carboxymuconolactone decarboxylase family protein [Planctomycetaceae bacterium]